MISSARPAMDAPPEGSHTAWQKLFGGVSGSDLKLTMAASGAVLSAYTAGHMAGNMQVYLGRERFNGYAEFLRTVGAPVLPRESALWVARTALILSTAAHAAAGTELTLRAMRAEGRTVRTALGDATRTLRGAERKRPRGRRRSVPRVIARSMRSTGVVLGLFTTYHVLDLTAGVRPAASADHEHGDAYGNLVASLSRPGTALLYAVSMATLAGHMVHGLRTAAMDTGLTTTAQRVRQVDRAAKAVGGVVAVGNVTIPLAVQLKVVR